MKNFFLFVFSLLSLSGFSFTPQPATTTVKPYKTVATAPAQQTVTYLRTHRQGKGVSVNWGVSSSSGIAGFTIQRSYDGEFFDPVYQIPCNGSARYSYKDEDIFPGYIYYRIECKMGDGTTSYSNVDVVRIVQHG